MVCDPGDLEDSLGQYPNADASKGREQAYDFLCDNERRG
jgi:hypothetical protein